ncbi:MAG TPA: hypothetical protein VGI10_21530 [Polyangiaceae bacterium]|jgi:hypothetical protein
MRRKFLLFCLAAPGLALTSGCNSCGADKPYTPFGVASSLPVESANTARASAAPSSPAPIGSNGFSTRKSLLAPAASKHFALADGAIDAPAGFSFAQVLPAEYETSGKPGALAWLVRDTDAPKDAPPGELWYFPNGRPAARLLALPGFVPSGPDCTLEPVLAQTGAHSATLDITAHCKMPLIARSPERSLTVVSPASARPELVTLRVAAPAPGETLDFRVDSSDQDQDGRDDVRIAVSVHSSASSEPASADLVWLDRPAGISRSSDEPRSSLAEAATRLATRSRIRHVGPFVDRGGNYLRLASTLCAEGGVARVLDTDGAPLRCGDLTAFIDNLTTASVEGPLNQGDLLGAFAAFARDGWYFARLSKTARNALERDLQKASARQEVTEATVARAVPLDPRTPHYSPLWFESDGALLVRTASGVTRISADGASEQALDPDAGTPLWPLDVTSGTGSKLVGVAHACDRSELLLLVNSAAGTPEPPIATSLLAARPASCAGHGTGPMPALAPLGFEGPSPTLLVAGAPVGTADLKALPPLPSLGAPRSPDGRLLVVPTSLGVFVGGERKELWRIGKVKDHSDATKLHDCVVQNDAKSVACVEAGKVVRFLRPVAAAK